jgi:hypothetical protein
MPVSDRGTLEDVSQSPRSSFKRCCKLLILNGEMLERSIRHAWKLIPLPRADAHQNPPTQSPSTTSRNNDARERVPVSRGICRGFRGVCDTVLTQNAVPVSEIRADAHRYALLCDVQELRRWSPEPLHVQNHGNISVAVKQVEPRALARTDSKTQCTPQGDGDLSLSYTANFRHGCPPPGGPVTQRS